MEDFSNDLPQWAKNRITYQDDKNIIESLILENKNWMNLYKNIGEIKNSIRHQEKISYLEKLLSDLDLGQK